MATIKPIFPASVYGADLARQLDGLYALYAVLQRRHVYADMQIHAAPATGDLFAAEVISLHFLCYGVPDLEIALHTGSVPGLVDALRGTDLGSAWLVAQQVREAVVRVRDDHMRSAQ